MVLTKKNNSNIRKKIEYVMEEDDSNSLNDFLNTKEENGENVNREAMIDLIESLLNPKKNTSGSGGRKIKKVRVHSF